MKIKNKIIIALVTMFLYMVVFPVIGVALFGSDDLFVVIIGALFSVGAVGIFIHPIMMIILSIMAGTNIQKLWWIPFVMHLCLPISFLITAQTFDWELILASYLETWNLSFLILGILIMVVESYTTRRKAKNTDIEEEK